jgi:dipeptidyl aminopeptidase/acylaminoacyl peptidase
VRTTLVALTAAATLWSVEPDRFVSSDQYRLSEVGEVRISPDGSRIAYSIQKHDAPGRPYSEMWLMDVSTAQSRRLGSDSDRGSGPRWSPDGRWIAFFGSIGGQSGLAVMRADGSDGRVLAPVESTNHSLPSTGEHLTWSPDGKQIAFSSAVPGPESAEANGDPMVIRRYLYKPTASTGNTRFDDNRRVHVFVADIATRQVRQLTSGSYYEHSLDWSPAGDEILFVSNHEADPDRVFNYDVFAVRVAGGSIRRLTTTKSAEYRPRWSPDGSAIVYQGTKRDLTSSETTMEDTHTWLMDRQGANRRDVGAMIDNRQGAPEWSHDGQSLYFTVQDHGNLHLYRLSLKATRAEPELVAGGPGSVGAWSLSENGVLAYAYHTSADVAQLYVKNGATPKQLTNLNSAMLASKKIAPVEDFEFPSFDGLRVQAFLTKPVAIDANKKYPMIVVMHGGPHGQQGPAFNLKSQVYAGRGFATLMVNYRGSTGYGQKFADAIFRDQNGGEAKDVLAGVDAALKRYPWIDAARLGIEGGSYGGQLTNWLITQTRRFKAAIPVAGISNLITENYMSYYHDYLAVEFGAFPHENDLLDVLWQRSPLKHVASVKTPVMFIHGENDNDVPIAEAEQFYIALKDVGVETIMIRYPREGHGLRETKHVVDAMDRSLDWYSRHFDVP